MIARRSLLALLGALPFVGIPAARAVVQQADDDPVARLHRWRLAFERQMKHHWRFLGPGMWAYYGDGYDGHGPPAHDGEYSHRQYIGRGDTALDAVHHWFAQLPHGEFHAIFWRTMPELSSERDFLTQRTEWRVYSTFALDPLKGT